jgi:hypothetical protein
MTAKQIVSKKLINDLRRLIAVIRQGLTATYCYEGAAIAK